ncbi:hypothetical protein P167DRAFT_576760 [Morchella conica CCBAS932]|uniref:Uncharacterized protein n=1 Tax=Morchella conica CCBAS932 TaxID=1392247 RepID=A0A3N4KVT7_9PEZI|nr:hypothetical protein P167DRAFT_576760 [Morchella conica CCBAS932]
MSGVNSSAGNTLKPRRDDSFCSSVPPVYNGMGYCSVAGNIHGGIIASQPEQMEEQNATPEIPFVFHRLTNESAAEWIESMKERHTTEGTPAVPHTSADPPATGLLASMHALTDSVACLEEVFFGESTCPPAEKAERAAFHLRVANSIVEHPHLIQKLGEYRRTDKISDYRAFHAALVNVLPEATRLVVKGGTLTNVLSNTCQGKQHLQPVLDALAWGGSFDKLKKCNQRTHQMSHQHDAFLRRNGFKTPPSAAMNKLRNSRERLNNLRDRVRKDELNLLSGLGQMNFSFNQASTSGETSGFGSRASTSGQTSGSGSSSKNGEMEITDRLTSMNLGSDKIQNSDQVADSEPPVSIGADGISPARHQFRKYW